MNAKEKHAIRGIVRDMRHNIKEVNSFIAEKGGLSIDGFIYRVKLQANDLHNMTVGLYYFEDDDI